MSARRQLHLGAFMRPVSIHTAWWRYPGAWPDANFNFKYIVRLIQKLEAGKFDAFFMADHLALLNMPMNALMRSATTTSFDPLTLLPALSVVTERIGLIATASTTFNDPYHIARKFASLDHISNGRSAWNLVTTSNPDAALNFGLDEHMEHGERYDRGREFYDVVTKLWDSWADDAFIRDVEHNVYFDPARMHVPDHRGEHFRVRGPLNVTRPPQGYPLLVQAGSSEAGQDLAAETAEVVFTAHQRLEDAQAFYRSLKGRLSRHGREPAQLLVMPGIFPVIGRSRAEALERHQVLQELIEPSVGLASLSGLLGGVDAARLPLDEPLPNLPLSDAVKSRFALLTSLAAREQLTVRGLYEAVAGARGHLQVYGTSADIADEMQAWFEGEAADGFNVMAPYFPGGLEAFTEQVVPELQRRGLFRRAYEGRTLREHLGLGRPPTPRLKAAAVATHAA
jgi:FMN-dependent oxidoreductase (nitrilotriacetate monooxygenase family)